MKGSLQKNVGTSGTPRISPWLFLPLIMAVLAFVALIPMTWQQPAFFGVLVVVAAFLIDRSKRGPAATILLVLLCLCATTRYGYWRSATLWEYLHRRWAHVSAVAAVLMLILVGAEFYTFLILVLGFFQTIAPLKRPPLLMPDDRQPVDHRQLHQLFAFHRGLWLRRPAVVSRLSLLASPSLVHPAAAPRRGSGIAGVVCRALAGGANTRAAELGSLPQPALERRVARRARPVSVHLTAQLKVAIAIPSRRSAG